MSPMTRFPHPSLRIIATYVLLILIQFILVQCPEQVTADNVVFVVSFLVLRFGGHDIHMIIKRTKNGCSWDQRYHSERILELEKDNDRTDICTIKSMVYTDGVQMSSLASAM